MRLIRGDNKFVQQVLTISDIISHLLEFVERDDEKYIVIDASSLHKNVKLNSLRLAILKEFKNLSVYYDTENDSEILIVKNIFSSSLLSSLNKKYLKLLD